MCLAMDSSWWDTKNLEVFWSQTPLVAANTTTPSFSNNSTGNSNICAYVPTPTLNILHMELVLSPYKSDDIFNIQKCFTFTHSLNLISFSL
jgi:hypothetical protein